MKFSLILVLIFSGIFISCSKKETTVDLSKNKQTTSNSQNQNTNYSAAYYQVKNVDSDVKKNESVNFSWSENGQDKKLSDYKGKVVLLNFWATWCGPCKHELPDLSQISKDLGDKDFKLIGVSVDQNPAMLDNFLKTNSLSYTVLLETNGKLFEKYMSAVGGDQDVIPQTYIIDKNGKIVEAIIGSHSKEDFLKIINKYL
jgi:peroxiredoxin